MSAKDIPDLANALLTMQTWTVIIVVVVFGMLGGYAHQLVSSPDNRTTIETDIVVGAVAALAFLFVFGTTDAVKLIALAVAAGYGGKAVLDATQAQTQAAVAKSEARMLKLTGAQSVDTVQAALHRAIELSKTFPKAEGGPAISGELSRVAGQMDVMKALF